ncbi:hypothetical protein LTR37_005252 [Vermiconidia calcicola]|uniref:Uncharacterized protein n=1 Tax=Vermiconidia calcicola TaxID=1690605 RepID=A0ACC3NJN5_9PEZI|nr:hypothetical protein LTR37_005252 [Vermiconidia calcicola]
MAKSRPTSKPSTGKQVIILDANIIQEMRRAQAAEMEARRAKASPHTFEISTKLASGGELTEISKYDPTNHQFYQVVKVQHNDAFITKPIVLTEGPMKGRRVLLLEPFETFRLLSLPPELRGMIYDILLDELRPTVKMGCRRFSGESRRPIRYGEWHLAKNSGVRDGATIAERVEQEPTAVVLAQVNKQISEEVLPLVYNTNFQFADTTSLNVFLERIGSMRKINVGYNTTETCADYTQQLLGQHLRHISLPREHGYTGGRGPKTFGISFCSSLLDSQSHLDLFDERPLWRYLLARAVQERYPPTDEIVTRVA